MSYFFKIVTNYASGSGDENGKVGVQTLTTRDYNGPQTNMPKNVGSVKT